MSLRTRLATFVAPKRAPLSSGGGYVYAVGPGGIEPFKSTGNPLLDAFHGIEADDGTFANTPQGWARAYKRSAWAFRCVLVRAQTLAAVPLRVQRADGEPLPEHPLARYFEGANTRLMFWTECDRLVFGPAYWEVARDRLLRLNPQTIERIVTRDGIQGYRQTLDGITTAEWSPREIVHFRDYDPDDDFGAVSAMSLALGGIDVTHSIGRFAGYFFSNGALPSGLLVSESPLRDTDRQRILADWKRQFQGVDRSHGTALLDGGRLTYTPITPPMKDLAMAELREEERREIAAAFGVPMTIALMTEAANYATSHQDYVNFYALTIKPEMDLLVDTMNRELVPLYGAADAKVEPVWDEVEALQEDRTAVTTRAAAAFPAGVMSLNEARRMQGLDPIQDTTTGTERDYFQLAGKLVPREALEAGDLSALEPPPAAPAFPFMGWQPTPAQLPARSAPQVIDQPSGKATLDVIIHAPDPVRAGTLRDTVVRDTMLRDLDRWERKVAKKGVATPFDPDYLPDAVTAWLRQDLSAWDGDTDRAAWVKGAFVRAVALVKADEDDFATPEEFEAYWRGIDELFDALSAAFEGAWDDVPGAVAAALRDGGQARAEDVLQAALSQTQEAISAALVGDASTPGPLVRIFLAGAARGNDLLQTSKSRKADPLTVDWTQVDQLAKAWAAQYAADLVRGVNDTTLDVFRTKIAAWVESGGSLEDLAKAIEGDLTGLDMPEGWSPDKIAWATSRERARLIAQTETTRAFHEGALTRWEQADVPNKRWRTAQDANVCDTCRSLNNVVAPLREAWVRSGTRYDIPAHVGCRCFAAPEGV